jgi:hypothetical protein
MRATTWVIIAIAGSLAGHEAARSADAPKFVIPGKPGVPVMINGYDASYSIVEGDWGLDRPTGVPPTIVSGPLLAPPPARYDRGYFPGGDGEEPGYGRLEVVPPPNRRLPPPAPRFQRNWEVDSDSTPAINESSATASPAGEPDDNSSNPNARRNRDRSGSREIRPQREVRTQNEVRPHREVRPRREKPNDPIRSRPFRSRHSRNHR